MNIGRVLAKQDRMIRKGRKTTQWERIRRRLKIEFLAKGIVVCETCGGDFYLTFAHRFKRRFITDETELKQVALLCLNCHDRVERLPHIEMYDRITTIIENRI
ncbi:MAG: hypothetical protein KGZ58_01135 [Ignavibacteriales bacterium]|nr:hypothetical protein [Ignavibacteriales bacterium]